jgi:hypothetical protein
LEDRYESTARAVFDGSALDDLAVARTANSPASTF